MTLRTLIIRYILFSVAATCVNLAAQRLVLSWGKNDVFFVIAIGCGTLAGLFVKYYLDKKWIFKDNSNGLNEHSRKFVLYASMGIFTTLIFWTVETAFWNIWQTDRMREVGAIIGLSVGYFAKYHLDKHYVFNSNNVEPVS